MSDSSSRAAHEGRDRSSPSPSERLSLADSQRFARSVRALMNECGLPSVYALFLEVDLPRATLHRWLSGRVRIPVAGAQTLTAALLEHAKRWENNASLRELHDLVSSVSLQQAGLGRLHAEFRVRGIPIGRAMEALRAANLIEPGVANHE